MFTTINKDKLFLEYLSQQTNIPEENKTIKTKKKQNNVTEDESLPNIDDKGNSDRKKGNMSSMMRTTNNFNLQSNSSSNSGFFSNVLL